jgi:hypothetical protein
MMVRYNVPRPLLPVLMSVRLSSALPEVVHYVMSYHSRGKSTQSVLDCEILMAPRSLARLALRRVPLEMVDRMI